MNTLALLLGTAINVALLGLIVRQLLGVPVGWMRTVVLSLIVILLWSPFINTVLRATGLVGETVPTRIEPAAVAVVVLAAVWIIVGEVIVLTALEAIVPTGSIPTLGQIVRGTPGAVRRSRRYAQLLRIATAHGLGTYLGPYRRTRDDASSTTARSLALALEEAGVTFIKLGQMLSTRPDLLPPAYIRELGRLHSAVAPVAWGQVRPAIEAELGHPLEVDFTEVDPDPLAAASVAQIHAARLHNGDEVVIKIQRPGARRQVTADLDILDRLARRFQRTTAWGRSLGVEELSRGFAASLREELDYRVEQRNMQGVAAASSDVKVPVTYPHLTTERLLVMERLGGAPLSAAGETLRELPAERRAEAGTRLFRAVMRQILVAGTFHADLHPGNIFIDDAGRVALLDFGSVGHLDASTRTSVTMLLAAIDREDAIGGTDAVIDLLERPAGLDDRRLERDMGQLFARFKSGFGSGASSSELFNDLLSLVVRHEFAVPPPVAAVFRTLGQLEVSLRVLTPQLDLVEAAREHGRDIFGEKLTPRAMRATLESQVAALLPVLQRLPRRVNRIAEELEAGEFTMNIRVFSDQRDRRFITGIVQQIIVAILAGSLALAGVVLIVSDSGPDVGGLLFYPFVGFALLAFAFLLGARALVLVFRRDRGT